VSIDQTHDPALRSWVESANAAAADFPIQNLPHAVFRRRGSGEAWRGGVAIGSQVLDMAAAVAAGVFPEGASAAAEAAAADALNSLMAMGRPSWRALRAALSRVLADGAPQAAQLASSARAIGAVSRSASTRPSSICSACACSTTGRRVMCRAGSRCRSGRFWPRTS
jgi:hypothetical protein